MSDRLVVAVITVRRVGVTNSGPESERPAMRGEVVAMLIRLNGVISARASDHTASVRTCLNRLRLFMQHDRAADLSGAHARFDRHTSRSRLPSLGLGVLLLLSQVVLPALGEDAPSIRWQGPSKTAKISAPFGNSLIVVGTSSRTAGAIDSLIWRGKEFVDRNDHGREFQSASTFSGKGECFNPTEAGSDLDSVGQVSTSRLLSLSARGNTLNTTTQMAYWIGPGSRSTKCHGTTSTVASALSDDLLMKTVTIGSLGIENAIEYTATFRIPDDRKLAGFEALTGYMPIDFSEFMQYDPSSDSLVHVTTDRGRGGTALIFSTKDERYALGVYSANGYTRKPIAAQYQWFRFNEPTRAAKTVKWNCYFEVHDVAMGDHAFTCFMVVGDLEQVRAGMRKLCRKLSPDKCQRE